MKPTNKPKRPIEQSLSRRLTFMRARCYQTPDQLQRRSKSTSGHDSTKVLVNVRAIQKTARASSVIASEHISDSLRYNRFGYNGGYCRRALACHRLAPSIPVNSHRPTPIEVDIWTAVGGRATLIGPIIGAILVNRGKTIFTGRFSRLLTLCARRPLRAGHAAADEGQRRHDLASSRQAGSRSRKPRTASGCRRGCRLRKYRPQEVDP